MQLLVRGVTGRTAVLDLPAHATGAEVKKALEARQGTPAEQLVLQASNGLLGDSQTLVSVGASDGMTLFASSRLRGGKPTKVKIITGHLACGSEVTIDIEPTSTKNEIKRKLAEVTGVPEEHQKVMLSGINQIVMGDKRTNVGFAACGTASGVQLAVEGK